MPKDEFDLDDPLELNGVAILTDEDTSGAMCECFIEEFLRMGWNHKQILALFKNPAYLGMNMVLENKGEPFVRDQIGDVFARWGRTVRWSVPVASNSSVAPLQTESLAGASAPGQSTCTCGNSSQCCSQTEPPSSASDPLGNPTPRLEF